jgi:hypothetical protein
VFAWATTNGPFMVTHPSWPEAVSTAPNWLILYLEGIFPQPAPNVNEMPPNCVQIEAKG